MKLKKIFQTVVFLFAGTVAFSADAAYESRFDALNFHPAIDGGDYFSVHGSDTWAQWQGHLGFYLDYANLPLQFTGTGAFAGTQQDIIDHMFVMHNFGSIGFTDWFTAGINIPVVLWNGFYSDEPVAAPTLNPDKAAMMGDIEVMTKFRLLDIEKYNFGIAITPAITLPSGDVGRYTGSGHVTGGGDLILEAQFHERFNMALNVGVVLRDDVLRQGVDMGHQMTYGLAGNIKVAQDWQLIFEGQGATVLRDFFEDSSSPLEAGGGVRYYARDSGFSFDLGGAAGLIDGVGTPRFRVFAGLKWSSPGKKEAPPPPDPRIQGNRIVTMGKIFYDTAKTTIKPVSYPVLDDVVDVLKRYREIGELEVQGHTDARGSDSYNMALSQGRAESAMNYLINKGIEKGRLRAKGYGESMPIDTNDTARGMERNRRTEFVIIEFLGPIQQGPSTGEPVSSSTRNFSRPVAESSSGSVPVTSGSGVYPNYSYPPPN